jgi:hypothetical protein
MVVVVNDGTTPDPEPQRGTPSWRAAVIEVQRYELTLAAEFDRCIGTEGWFEAVDEVARPFRAEFLEEHQTLIDPVLDESA